MALGCDETSTADAGARDPQAAADGGFVDMDAVARDSVPPDALAPDAQTLDAGCLLGGGSRAASASLLETFIERGGRTVDVLPNITPQAWFLREEGCFVEPSVTTSSVGLTVGGLPERGVLYVGFQESAVWVVMERDDMDLGAFVLGRADAVAPMNAVGLSVDLDGLSPWGEFDDLQIYSSDVGMWGFFIAGRATMNPPVPMATSVRGMTIDILGPNIQGAKLIDAARGDRLFITQLTVRTTPGGHAYSVATRSVELSPFSLKEGRIATSSGTMALIPMTATISVDWRRSEFAAAMSAVSPDATPLDPAHALYVSAMPFAEYGGYGVSGDLALIYGFDGVDESLELNVGNPYPGTEMFAAAQTTVERAIALPGAQPYRPQALITSWVPSSTTAPLVFRPPVSPVRNPRIEGRDLFARQTGVGETPVLTWEAPSTTAAGLWYDLIIRRLSVNNGRTVARRVIRLSTLQTSVRVPPGFLTVGEPHMLIILAATRTAEEARTPFKSMLPNGSAYSISDIFVP